MSDLRIPRPKGLTNLCLKDIPSNEKESRMAQLICSHYINNGFTYLGTEVTIDRLAELLNRGPQWIHSSLALTSGAFSSLLTPDSQQAANQSLAYLYDSVLTWAYKDRHRAEKLYGEAEAQIRYPNGAIKTNMANLLVRILEQGSKTSGTLLNVLDSLRTSNPNPQGPQILASNPQGAAQGPEKAITTQEALNLIQDMAQKALTDGSHFEAIFEAEGLSEVPEVRAMGAETEGTKSLKASRHDLLSEEIIIDLEID